jgi:multidrug efflux pump subunit AcrA (membrane-fusion protein)
MIKKIKKLLIKSKIVSLVILVLIVGLVFFGVRYFVGNNKEAIEEDIVNKKQVEVIKIDKEVQNSNEIETVGTVKAEAKVDVVALVGGTVSSDFFDIGDDVVVNQVLTDLFSNNLLTNYNNAQTNFSNAVNSLDTTMRLTDESIRQAGIGVLNAEEAIKSAEIGLENANDNLNNSLALQDKGI